MSALLRTATRPRRVRLLFRLGLIVSLGLIVVACGNPSLAASATGEADRPVGASEPTAAAEPGAATRASEGGQVTVKLTWNGSRAAPAFEVSMSTHSVDLDSYDLAKLAVLRTESGLVAQPTSWDAPLGGHHRSGTLTFPAAMSDGSPLVGLDARWVEVVVRDMAGVNERVFRWEL